MTTPPAPDGQPPGQPRADWYVPAWLDVAELPSFEVMDTRSAQGRLDPRPKVVTVADLILFHGHACDGLLRSVWAMRALADAAFDTAPFDRSDLLVVSKNSPCLGDVAAYLTGGRARFGTHRLNGSLGVGFQIRLLSTRETWEVREEPGFFPELIGAWEAALLGDIDEADKRELLAVHEAAQWDWVRRALLPSAPADHYRVQQLDVLELPPALLSARRTDTVNRAVGSPVEVVSPYDPDLDAPGPTSPAFGRWAERYEVGPG
jgi:formylmethanofuran dehydrogenase subunit E